MTRISTYKEKLHTKTALAYLAGIIDGEGAICIHNASNAKKKVHYNTTISVSSTDKVLIEWLTDEFGGKLLEYTKEQRPKNSRKPVFRWQASGKMLEAICKYIYPYLIIKKEEVEIMLKMRETFKPCRSKWIKGKNSNVSKFISSETIAIRDECAARLKKLHCRNYKK